MDRNTEIEQYFALWKEPFPVAASHDHWVRWGKLLRMWLSSIDGVPMNVEVAGDFPRGLKKWEPLCVAPTVVVVVTPVGLFLGVVEDFHDFASRLGD